MMNKETGISELEENEVMGKKEAQDECVFLHAESMSMDSLIENYKDYKGLYEKADLNYRTLEADNKLDGNSVYNYYYNKEIYDYLKDEIVRRTIDNYNMTKKSEINENEEMLGNNLMARGMNR